MPVLVTIILGVCAAASFFFALAETSLFSLARWQVRQLEERAPAAGGLVARLLTQPQDLLATIVLGNTLANGTLVMSILWMSFSYEWPLLLTLGVLFALILLGCEAAPKTLAVRSPELWALRVVHPVALLVEGTRHLRLVAQRVNSKLLAALGAGASRPAQPAMAESEYRELLEMAFQQGTLAECEKEIILQIVNLDRRTARDVMRPRSQMAWIPDNLEPDELLAEARRRRHSRLPMYDERAETIVGILNVRRYLLDPEHDLEMAIEMPSFVPESMNLLQLLKSLQQQKRGLAIVLNEYGGIAGIVSIEDILESLMGRLRTGEESEAAFCTQLGEGRWEAGGVLRLEDFRRKCPALGETPGVDTLGGLMLRELGQVPVPGQSIAFRGLKLTATETDERRVRKVLIEAQTDPRSKS